MAVLAAAFATFVFPSHADPVVPLTRVHAHNDYEHKHPLFDALGQGFCSVEADIHLVNGKLLVAHDIRDINPKLTLQSLYLDPLRKRIKQNGGRVYKDGPECTLLIDFKTDGQTNAEAMYFALREVLKEYADIISVFRDGKKETKAIVIVLTGGYPRNALMADSVRYAACDGKLPDLKSNPPADLVAWISEDWTPLFKWRGGSDPMPDDELKQLKDIVRQAHEQGRRVRFWGSPDKPFFWKTLLEQGVDLINTDDLKGFRKFYTGAE
ncbi:MAG: Secreted protein [Pedosphaera sp.]|nr:Secreted protein [Pedosphaera sp.]